MLRVRIPCLLTLLAAPLATGSAGAQSPAARDSIAALRDSLARVTDTVSLLALEARTIDQARRDTANAMLHLRLGFLALRLGDLSGTIHFDHAASEFEWASTLQPRWPVPWFGLGLAELAAGDSRFALISGLQTMLARDALTRSANAFARSAEVDPEFVDGLVELSKTALRQRINARTDVALAALRRANRTKVAGHPAVLLALGRVERDVGSLDSSRLALTRLLAIEPKNAVAELELARTDFLLRRSEANTLWYQGLADADSEALRLYRTDLSYIMPDSVLRQFDQAPSPDARVQLVRQFWDTRDRDELRRPGDRLREHYRRIDYARHNFGLVSVNRQYDISERFKSAQSDFDDRGVIYIRHGAPEDVVAYDAPGVEPNLSWRYHRPDGDLLFHFIARQDVQDYRLVESVLDILGFSQLVRLQGTGDIKGALQRAVQRPNEASFSRMTQQQLETALQNATDARIAAVAEALFRSREQLSPIYTQLLVAGTGASGRLQAEERALGRESIALGTTTDSWPLRFAEMLPSRVELLALGSSQGQPTVQVAFAIPGSALSPDRANGALVYPVRMRVSVLALDGTVVTAIDTTRLFTTRTPIPPREFLLGRLPVRVAPGTFTIRVSLQNGEAGMVSPRDTIRVPSASGPTLGLSDLALGTRGVHLQWATGPRDTAWVNPLGAYKVGEPMELYFEVLGLPEGTDYRVELSVTRPGGTSFFGRLFGKGGASLRMGFEQKASGPSDPVRRELAIKELTPGKYILEVSVSAPSRPKVTRRQIFVVTQ